ncbi:type II toxin-antitoxin system HicB family antitoxin [Hippea alviniae]|uniref:type II toxin-antitoxin system HicB family antitoxin n=1 Tax=Hippea alviniae TaxID=1279027 RepID=UPI0003B5FB8F|nr:type II toxin-antitoxin system HicB family antitoxin [Hippea alviniae]
MKTYTAIIEKCKDTGLYVGYIPGIKGAHSQGETVDELIENLKEVLKLLEEDGALEPESEFVGVQNIVA